MRRGAAVGQLAAVDQRDLAGACGIRPAMARSTVDLPEPDSPTRPSASPAGNAKRHIAGGAHQRGAGAVGDGDAFEFDHAAAPTAAGRSISHAGSRCNCGSSARRWPSSGQGGEQAPRVGMSRFVQPAGVADLDDLAGIHHQHPVAERRDEMQVVADEDQPHAAASHQLVHDGEHLLCTVRRAPRWVRRRSGCRGPRSASWRS